MKNQIKKIISINLAICIFTLVGILAFAITNTNSSFALNPNNINYGDLDDDGSVTMADIVILKKAINNLNYLNTEQRLVSDVNLDGKIDRQDEYILERYIVDTITTLPYTDKIPDITYGDINLDGYVTSADSVSLASYLNGNIDLSDSQKINADVNLDGKVDEKDSNLLSKYLINEIILPYNESFSISTSVLSITRLELGTKEANAGEKVYLKLDIAENKLTAGKIYFDVIGNVDDINNYRFGVEIKGINTDNKYIIIPNDVPSNEYGICEIILYGEDNNNKTFSNVYSSITHQADFFVDFVNEDEHIKINGTKTNQTDIKIGDISLSKSTAKTGEEVNINIENKSNIFSMELLFKSDNTTDSFKVYLNRFNIAYEGAYFIIPNNINAGNYNLYQIIVSNGGDTTTYTKGNNLKDISLKIIESETNNYIYSNVNFGDKQLNEILNAPNDTNIKIDANVNSIINQKVFEAIKGTNKQLVIIYRGNEIIFNGNNITNPKSIDVAINIDNNNNNAENANLTEIINDIVIINLSPNGELPGKSIYRIYATDEIKNILGTKDIYLYYYNEESNKFNLVEKNIKLNDSYYELNIEHNSKYILTKNKIESKYIEKENNTIETNQSKKTSLIIIGCTFIILVIMVIILLLKKGK